MRENITSRVMRCTKCGEAYVHYRGVSDTRCESCWDDEPKQEKPKDGKDATDRALQP